MPTYSYACKNCKYEFEAFHGMNDKQICTNCNSESLLRLFKQKTINLPTTSSTIRERVEKHIEEARQSLKEQLQEARKDYKP